VPANTEITSRSGFCRLASAKAAWNVAPGETVNLDDAELAIEIGTEQLDAGFFMSAGNGQLLVNASTFEPWQRTRTKSHLPPR
jgi:hypothetical protein